MKKFSLFACVLVLVLLCGCSFESDISSTTFNARIKISKTHVHNGDTISLTTSGVRIESNGKPLPLTVSYYCEDNLLGYSSDSVSHYRVEYIVKELEVGTHEIVGKVETKKKCLSSESSGIITLKTYIFVE